MDALREIMKPTFHDILQYRGRAALRSDSRARRKAIFEAALWVIEKEGVRGVKHRAVASEAQVPLAATTYYFDDIQSLLHDAFVHYVETRLSSSSEILQNQALELLQGFGSLQELDLSQKHRLAEGVAEILYQHVRQQVEQAAERRVEVAFRHEALCNKDLAAVVAIPHQLQLRAIEECMAMLASAQPKADAQVIMGTLLYLEYNLSIKQTDSAWSQARATLQRMIEGLLRLADD